MRLLRSATLSKSASDIIALILFLLWLAVMDADLMMPRCCCDVGVAAGAVVTAVVLG